MTIRLTLAAVASVTSLAAGCTEFAFERLKNSAGAAGSPLGGRAGSATAGSSGATSAGGAGSTAAGGSSGSGGASAGTGGYAAAGTGPTRWEDLALTPPMGWNSWNRFSGSVNESIVQQIAEAMVSSGMRDAGYRYVVIDDTWQAPERDAGGNVLAERNRFPSGMQALAEHIHGLGLLFGIYSDRGTQTCAGRPGSYGFETADANTYAEWGVDYLKYDNCFIPTGREGTEAMREDYTAMRDALEATGRPIVYSICAWWFYDWMPAVGHLWRTTTDIRNGWEDNVLVLLNRNGGYVPRYDDAVYAEPGIGQYAGPGGWNDPDMLEVGNGTLSDVESRSHFGLWAMMAAPLIAGNDLRSMSAATRAILTNAEVIAVDQDTLGKQGAPISASTELEVWAKPLAGGAHAVLLFNRTDLEADITVTWQSLGISGAARVRDLWLHAEIGRIPAQYTASAIPPHGSVMLLVTPE